MIDRALRAPAFRSCGSASEIARKRLRIPRFAGLQIHASPPGAQGLEKQGRFPSPLRGRARGGGRGGSGSSTPVPSVPPPPPTPLRRLERSCPDGERLPLSSSRSSIGDDGRPGMRRDTICSLPSRATAIGSASPRHAAISRPSWPNGPRANLPVSATSGEEQPGAASKSGHRRLGMLRLPRKTQGASQEQLLCRARRCRRVPFHAANPPP